LEAGFYINKANNKGCEQEKHIGKVVRPNG